MRLGRMLGNKKKKLEPPAAAADQSTRVPEGAQVIPTSLKQEYDTIPMHVYHPNPYDAITILRHKKKPHEWLVAGWYVDTYREGGKVKGLMYRKVESDQDKEVVLNELKKKDKDVIAKFSLEQS